MTAPLTVQQRRHLSAVRKLISSHEWAAVAQGIALLESLDDPQLWQLMASGVSLSPSSNTYLRLSLEKGELKTRVKLRFREQAALFAARHAGLLDDLAALSLGGHQSFIADIRPLAGLQNLLKLHYAPFEVPPLLPGGIQGGVLPEVLVHPCQADLIPDLGPLRLQRLQFSL